MIRKILILPLAFLLLANVAQAHFLGVSSVDSGEIRWGGSTTYSTQWNAGISTWNGLNPIDILPDTWWTYEDLTVGDVNNSNLEWYGRYNYDAVGSDEIDFNIYYLSSRTSTQKQNTTTHELGHALGLAHSYSGNVMYTYQTSQTALGSHDISDYNYLW